MRALALIPVLLVAACGEAPAENKAAPAAAAPSPGQWELTTEVTRFTKADQGTPRIDTPAGTRTTARVCVGPGDQLPSAFFAGENFTCTYPTYYVRGGRINLTLNCRREGLSGDIPMTVNGTFTGDSAEYTRNTRTVLVSDGDVEIDARVAARRTGDCTPAAASEGAPK
jgi:hypothetical protein